MTSQPHLHPAYREHPRAGKPRKINGLSRYDVAGQLNSSRALTWPAGAMGRRHGPGQQCRSHTEWQACDGLAQALHKNWGILSDAPINHPLAACGRCGSTGQATSISALNPTPMGIWCKRAHTAGCDTRCTALSYCSLRVPPLGWRMPWAWCYGWLYWLFYWPRRVWKSNGC